MPEPAEPRFACVGCGAMNPVGAESCSGCGHRFAGPPVAPSPPMKSEAAPASARLGSGEVGPSRRGGAFLTFAKIVGGSFLVLLSSAIAFVVTCFPIGLTDFNQQGGGNLILALVVGVVAALLVGGVVAYLLGLGRRKRAAKGRSMEDRP